MIVRHRTPASVIDRSFDRTFDQLTSSLFTPVRRGPEVLASWDGDTLVLTVDLPGVSAEQVSVETAGRTLTLAADTDSMQWTRSVQIGNSLDLDKIEAAHLNGRLTVRIGAVDAPETRQIPVRTTLEATPLSESGAPGRVEIPAMEIPASESSAAQKDTQSSPTNSTGSQ
jgi:HSP20 family molecular chaperone IbpA